MPALNFSAQFVPAVENGLDRIARRPMRHPGVRPKLQTIRALRKDGRDPKPGDTLYLYTGMRTKFWCRKLGEVTCRSVASVRISGRWVWAQEIDGPKVRCRQFSFFLEGERIGSEIEDPYDPYPTLTRFAKRDGFEHAGKMGAWFEHVHGLPFEGVLIRW